MFKISLWQEGFLNFARYVMVRFSFTFGILFGVL